MYTMTAEDVKATDTEAARLGVSTDVLMHRAGEAIAAAALAQNTTGPIAILCGPGNNGGDGFAAALRLHAYGREVDVYAAGPQGEPDAVRAEWKERHDVLPLATFEDRAGRYAVVIDALLGVGLSRPLEGVLLHAVRAANQASTVRLAVDVPSGVDADRAAVPGEAFQADVTVQLDACKPASALEPARSRYGRWSCADIGMPAAARDPRSGRLERSSGLPPDRRTGHKYRRGTLLIVAGSVGYPGAARLAALGAHRRGVGLLSVATYASTAGYEPATVGPLPLDVTDPPSTLQTLPAKQRQAVLVGPGLTPQDAQPLVEMAATWDGALVLDAGALEGPTLDAGARKSGARPWITPHAGEAAQLLNTSATEVAGDPLGAAQALRERWQVGVILKGPGTVVVDPDGAWWLIEPGPPALARGGSGDVLAGTIAASLAIAPQSPGATVARAVRAHAAAGVLAFGEHGAGMTASDVAQALPHAKSLDGVRW